MKQPAPETPSVQSLDRGLIILEAVAKADGPVPLGQLRSLLGINRSSVFRLANTLRRRGFLANPRGRNDYMIGPSIWRLFRNYDWNMLVSFCRPHLSALANKTGETAHLAVRQGKQTLFIDHQSSSNQIIAVSGQTGEFKPLYCTAHGKALLADCGLSGLKTILGSEPFRQYTPQTLRSIEYLAQACARIKKEGYALDDSEFEEQVRCVAAPIRDNDGSIVAAIGISAPATRLATEQLAEVAHQVAATAREISNELRIEI
jgi:DNA-binding IclR family transcriptional regulator